MKINSKLAANDFLFTSSDKLIYEKWHTRTP